MPLSPVCMHVCACAFVSARVPSRPSGFSRPPPGRQASFPQRSSRAGRAVGSWRRRLLWPRASQGPGQPASAEPLPSAGPRGPSGQGGTLPGRRRRGGRDLLLPLPSHGEEGGEQTWGPTEDGAGTPFFIWLFRPKRYAKPPPPLGKSFQTASTHREGPFPAFPSVPSALSPRGSIVGSSPHPTAAGSLLGHGPQRRSRASDLRFLQSSANPARESVGTGQARLHVGLQRGTSWVILPPAYLAGLLCETGQYRPKGTQVFAGNTSGKIPSPSPDQQSEAGPG